MLPPELLPPLILLLLVALAANVIEMRNSLQAPVCPQCVHCRHEAMARQEREEAAQGLHPRRMWGVEDREDDDRPRR